MNAKRIDNILVGGWWLLVLMVLTAALMSGCESDPPDVPQKKFGCCCDGKCEYGPAKGAILPTCGCEVLKGGCDCDPCRCTEELTP